MILVDIGFNRAENGFNPLIREFPGCRVTHHRTRAAVLVLQQDGGGGLMEGKAARTSLVHFFFRPKSF